MSEMDEAARRREEVAQLRAAARSTTPEAYRVRPVAKPVTDPMAESKETYTTLFGVFTKDRSPREAISIACMLGANGLAYILLILVLNLAQCSWWYEPGMYNSGYEHEQRIGR
jgi:hypothetical protein